MGRKRKQRRQPHGSAWHWKQTGCWYYTMPGTKKRVPLFDEDGQRIRGESNKEAAELALAKEKLTWEDDASGAPGVGGPWLVARVCSEYIQYCERGVASGTISKGHRDNTVTWLNDLCGYCGGRPVTGLMVRFITIKEKLGWDRDPVKTKYSCYTCRHTFAHRMLSGYWTDGVGCSIETLAELIGNTPKVAFDHYGREWGQHYQDPLWSAIGAGESD